MNKEIKQGYKQTDLGVIPEDWKILPIKEIFNSFPTASYSKDEMRGGAVKCIHYGDIHTKYSTIVSIKKDEIPTIEEYQAKRYIKLKNGDLIVADASEDYAGVGKCIEVTDCDASDVISGLHTIPLRDKNNNYVDGFRGYVFQSKSIKTQLERQSVGTKVYSISYNSIKECLLTIPTPTEQQAIASVLSDIDSLIATLDKKIAKKQALKQGAMQQLLTAKKRLPGFTEPWVEKKLGNIGDTYGGLTGKRKEDFGTGSAKYITFLNVLSNPILKPELFENVVPHIRNSSLFYLLVLHFSVPVHFLGLSQMV
ncbi:MAG: restriction endonuclease subunit S [Bacteroidales bacterium]